MKRLINNDLLFVFQEHFSIKVTNLTTFMKQNL